MRVCIPVPSFVCCLLRACLSVCVQLCVSLISMVSRVVESTSLYHLPVTVLQAVANRVRDSDPKVRRTAAELLMQVPYCSYDIATRDRQKKESPGRAHSLCVNCMGIDLCVSGMGCGAPADVSSAFVAAAACR